MTIATRGFGQYVVSAVARRVLVVALILLIVPMIMIDFMTTVSMRGSANDTTPMRSARWEGASFEEMTTFRRRSIRSGLTGRRSRS